MLQSLRYLETVPAQGIRFRYLLQVPKLGSIMLRRRADEEATKYCQRCFKRLNELYLCDPTLAEVIEALQQDAPAGLRIVLDNT